MPPKPPIGDGLDFPGLADLEPSMRLIWHKLQQTQESLTENTNQTAVDATTTCKGKPQTSFLNPSSLLWSDLCGDVNRNERAQRRHLEHKTSLVSGSHESSRIYIYVRTVLYTIAHDTGTGLFKPTRTPTLQQRQKRSRRLPLILAARL